MNNMSKEKNKLNNILENVKKEFMNAINQHDKMNSAHEGYAVILEELDELWDEVKLKEPDNFIMFQEAKQIAAMAIRFIYDLEIKEAQE